MAYLGSVLDLLMPRKMPLNVPPGPSVGVTVQVMKIPPGEVLRVACATCGQEHGTDLTGEGE